MDRACVTHGSEEENQKRRDQYEDNIKSDGVVCARIFGLMIRTRGPFCEDNNDISGSAKYC
jgi:hypothetical protein